MGVPGVTLPHDPIQDQPDYQAALNAFQALPSVRVMFDNGAGGAPGTPYPSFEADFNRFPIPKTRARSFYFGSNGSLVGKPPKKGRKGGSDTFTWDKAARPATDFAGTDTGGGDLWTAHPSFDWRQPPAGTAASFVSAPLARDAAIIGGGAVYAWIRASVPVVDLQVTVSEVRPDGKETYVQSGYLRSSSASSTRRLSSPARAGPRAGPWGVGEAAEGEADEADHPALLRGPPLSSRVADPRHGERARPATSRSGRSRRPFRPTTRMSPSPSPTSTSRASSSRSCRGSRRPPRCHPARGCAASPAGTTRSGAPPAAPSDQIDRDAQEGCGYRRGVTVGVLLVEETSPARPRGQPRGRPHLQPRMRSWSGRNSS